ncbi:ArgR family transcriptional regulator [Enterococcus dongliensis]|uniref:Arginine repressor n=1 Tax=Enterococcus dongliensis TaxID=2559925 RepID=A0AAP5KT61_9ENTE|nr:ArgR family transcriptional regulator [Enterococcus dongliensis]MDT2596994.1 ArgR family transcriptional regulator [Enterococcus dongliensis]MDT2633358.1 ArgR family transcriptional regulator [Enterococcus dongliensis]MDT2636709.1 ArgR family transcriptional regulator [Enterococcus dongliensis]MDT2638828.1 ArgR family transcriptional regulator [Enterococcus dongliensis]MDT2641420.1 ArgR family transcriptional regulator [Enterococcus dongliensis]
MRKKDRHELIKQIISENPIRNQNELMDYLQRYHVSATQATISRDIRDLKIVKTIDESGKPRFELFQDHQPPTEDDDIKRLIRMTSDVIVKVATVQFMTIVNTLPDNAHLLASVLDDLSSELIVATMASFDTIIIISKTPEDAQKVADFLQNPTQESIFTTIKTARND